MPYLYQDKCNHHELQSILSTYFGGRSGNTFTLNTTIHTIVLEWDDEYNNITNIIVSKKFPEATFKEIQNYIYDKLLANVEEAVSQRYIYSHVKLNGYFKYKDIFQIIPLPHNLPQSNITYDNHPFILQFKYLKTNDLMINVRRQTEVCYKFVRLLNVFLKNGITYSQNTGTAIWGIDFETGNLGKFQEGYHHLDFTPFSPSNFSDTNQFEKVKEINYQEYYQESSFPYQEIVIPDNLSSSIDLAHELKSSDWNKFMRACTWIEMADKTWQDSRSSSFVSYVSALESFLEQPEICKPPSGCGQLIASTIKDGEVCEVCHQPRLKLNSRFKQFLSDHGIPDEFKREKDLLYRTRSGLTHGGFLLVADLSPFDRLGDKAFQEGQLHRRLHYICIIVLYNWIRNIKKESN